ncbi:mite allergen Der p 3-like [Leguminivora glycinivorella]|uniref:mite allergen Der p 3-like n=1 Tax=Leguminivora glycinivorella TaxID=1035111 RepID=UPI00200BBB2E|nr:mite allergen Der p 3-like [Leguminivora glycinivorella]
MTMSYDIALCKLKQSLKFNANVKRLVMVEWWILEKLDTRKAELAGWGVVEETKFKDMKMLKSVVQEMWTRKECDAVLYNLPEGTLCGGEEKGKDFVSSGDGGSGLVYKRRTICGVYSYKDIQVSRSMAVYTNVSHFYDWVASNAKRLECD